MKRWEITGLLVLLIIFMASVVFNVHYCTTAPKWAHRDTVIVYDTVTVVKPLPKDSIVTRYITVRLPSVEDSVTACHDAGEDFTELPESVPDKQESIENFGESVPDSVNVRIPITQKEYAGANYRAWVSGYRASLDSIKVYERTREITTMAKPKRWSVGIQVGYGMTLKGTPQFAPYVGVGVSCNLFNF